jgi:Cu/Ag efflux protein CusF
MFKHKALTVLALVVVLLLAGSMVALAEEPNRQQEIRGEVIAVRSAAGAIAIRTASAPSIIVYVNERTRYVVPGVREPGLDDINVGDQITAAGVWRTRSEFDAALITVTRPVVRPVELSGKVKAIEAPVFVLETRAGDKRIMTNASTRFSINGIQNMSLADVRVGDEATVNALAGNDGTLTALIVIIRRPQPRPIELSGQVIAVDMISGTLTLQVRNNEEKLIQTNDKTRFVVPGVVTPTLSDVHVGDQALVTALAMTNATSVARPEQLLALAVVIQRPRPQPIRLAGEVTAIDLEAKTFSLKTNAGEVKTIVTGERTQFIVTSVKRPTLADVRVGDQAIVTGMTDPTAADPTRVLAQVVAIRRPLPRPTQVRGEVLTIDTENLQMTVQDGEAVKTVKWDASTRFCVLGAPRATIADIKVGDKIVAIGFLNEDGSLQAKIIATEGCIVPDVNSLVDIEDLESI